MCLALHCLLLKQAARFAMRAARRFNLLMWRICLLCARLCFLHIALLSHAFRFLSAAAAFWRAARCCFDFAALSLTSFLSFFSLRFFHALTYLALHSSVCRHAKRF